MRLLHSSLRTPSSPNGQSSVLSIISSHKTPTKNKKQWQSQKPTTNSSTLGAGSCCAGASSRRILSASVASKKADTFRQPRFTTSCPSRMPSPRGDKSCSCTIFTTFSPSATIVMLPCIPRWDGAANNRTVARRNDRSKTSERGSCKVKSHPPLQNLQHLPHLPNLPPRFFKPGVHAVKPRPNLFPRASCFPRGGGIRSSGSVS